MILVTGGAGYIGSHTCIELLQANYEIVVVDNFSNSTRHSLDRVKEITKKNFEVYDIDITDSNALGTIFNRHSIDGVIHLAGLKSVGESVEMPLKYFYNNITGALVLCNVMQMFGIKKMVFSSSATVYGESPTVPIVEEFPLNATNPYGRSKLFIEQILHDLYQSDPSWSISILRYFNPTGAHKSGLIGEDPLGIPNNLMPYITQVAAGLREKLYIYGNDYDTPDGTAVRDYIHVMDLAKGHIKALQKIQESTGIDSYNLGTGKGYSVLEIVHCFEEMTNQEVPYDFTMRRKGDSEQSYADPSKANEELDWFAERDIKDMCKDSWNWQKNKIKVNMI
jgi:UDP-glucose-4-epimerase